MCLRLGEVLFFVQTKEKAAKSSLQVGSGRPVCHHGFALRHIWDQIPPLLSTSCVGLGKPPSPHPRRLCDSIFSSEKGGHSRWWLLWGDMPHRPRNAEPSLNSSKHSVNATNSSISNSNAASPVVRRGKHILATFPVEGPWGTCSYC